MPRSFSDFMFLLWLVFWAVFIYAVVTGQMGDGRSCAEPGPSTFGDC